MGWEYHRRTRDSSGRFYSLSPGRTRVQLHIRLTPRQANWLRAQSIKRQMTLSRYVLTAAVRYEQVSRFMRHRQREKERGPLEEERSCPDD